MKRFFSHCLVSVKNRNSPVTFILDLFDYLQYVHLFVLIISNCPHFMNSLQKERIAIKCIYSSRKMCLVTVQSGSRGC